MTYLELYENAFRDLEHSKITLGEFEERIKPLKQEIKTGHWFYDKSIENWRCSECNEVPKTMGYCGSANFMAKHFKFCNHCGVRMIEPQESEG